MIVIEIQRSSSMCAYKNEAIQDNNDKVIRSPSEAAKKLIFLRQTSHSVEKRKIYSQTKQNFREINCIV